jgi:hypothetical protein
MLAVVGVGLAAARVYFFVLDLVPAYVQGRSAGFVQAHGIAVYNSLLLSLTFPALCIVAAVATRKRTGS